MKNILDIRYSIILFSALTLLVVGCKKDYLVTNPSDQVSGETVFETTEGAMVALDGTYRSMYSSLTNHGNFGQKSYDLVLDLMGDDMVVHKQGYNWFNGEYQYGTAITNPAADQRSERTWYYYYRIINNVNLILTNLDAATGAEEDKNYIKGQSLALRAHSYFYLINFFQQNYKGNENKPGVPIYTEPTTEGKGRGTVQEVYDQILADLTEAEKLLQGATKYASSHLDVNGVYGIRARVALQMDDYSTARDYASKARDGYSPMTSAQYAGTGFNTISSPEWLWGLEVNTEQATIYASFWSHMDVTTGGYADLGTQKKISKALYDKIQSGDVRKTLFVPLDAERSSTFPVLNQSKFRVRTPGAWASDYLLMRAGEMYLIEAEASARLGDEANAITVLTQLVKTRFSDYNITSLSGNALMDEILLQRRIELWGEGFRLLDIKRLKTGLNRPTGDGNHGGWDLQSETEKANNVQAGVTTLPDLSPRFLLKIPQDELNTNKQMSPADQNP